MTNTDNNNNNNNNNNNKTVKRYRPLSLRPPVHLLNNAVSDNDDEFMQLQKIWSGVYHFTGEAERWIIFSKLEEHFR